MDTEPSTATAGSNSQLPRRIVICGGGVIGVCTAYFLASKGSDRVSVTVVERSSIACAASGKAGGFLALDWCDGTPVADLARASFLLHRSLSDLLDGPRAYGYRALSALSLPLLTSGSTESRSPDLPSWINGSAVSQSRTIGTPETTLQVHPQLFTRAVLSSATAKYGVEVVFREVLKFKLRITRCALLQILSSISETLCWSMVLPTYTRMLHMQFSMCMGVAFFIALFFLIPRNI